MLDRVREPHQTAPRRRRPDFSSEEAALAARRRRRFLLLTSVHFGVGLAAFLLTHDYVTGGPVSQALSAHLAATEASLAGAAADEQAPTAAAAVDGGNATQIAKAAEAPPVTETPPAEAAPPAESSAQVVEKLPEITMAAAIEQPVNVQPASDQQASSEQVVAEVPEVPDLPAAPPSEVTAAAEQQVALATVAAPAVADGAVSASGHPLMAGQMFRDCENCPDMVVVVPPRTATGEISFVQPGQGIRLAPYAIGRTEVTFDLWDSCVGAGACEAIADDGGWGRGDRPVINVSHDMIAKQFLPWLTKVSGHAYALPLAAEWDYAALGIGAPGVQAASLPAQSPCEAANFAEGSGDPACADGFPTTAPVASLRPNGLGLHDMRGNVWEWLDDCWTPGFTYKAKPSESDCRRRLLRGGSWSSRAASLSDQLNGWEVAAKTKNAIGFRLLRKLP